MLGRFLELALVTEDTGAAWQEFLDLGFAPATAGDVWSYPYGVVACEGLAIGLHGRGSEAISLHFVKPDVAALARALEMFRIETENVRLGSDVFNELTLREPGGVALRVVEARTFSPPAEVPRRTSLGVFRGISLPCADLDEARWFWELMGMEVRERESPWEGFDVVGVPVACHARRMFREPVAWFERNESRGDSSGSMRMSADAGQVRVPGPTGITMIAV